MPKPEAINKKAAKIFELKDTIEKKSWRWALECLLSMGNEWYKVSIEGDKTSCECQYHKKR